MSASSWRHLIIRFFDVITSRPLELSDRRQVDGWLSDAERTAFHSQPVADQRHGLEAARHVARVATDRPDLIRAALLHDLGKRHARLGVVGRSLVSAWAKLGGTTTGRARTYLDHGPKAAEELADWGAEDLVIEFARHHHGERPFSINQEDWALLQAADH